MIALLLVALGAIIGFGLCLLFCYQVLKTWIENIGKN
jgi:hypothetical protein